MIEALLVVLGAFAVGFVTGFLVGGGNDRRGPRDRLPIPTIGNTWAMATPRTKTRRRV